MNNNNQKPVAANNSAGGKTLQQDIHAKWDKLSEIEIGSLKDADGLADQLVAKYGLERVEARKQADAAIGNRSF